METKNSMGDTVIVGVRQLGTGEIYAGIFPRKIIGYENPSKLL